MRRFFLHFLLGGMLMMGVTGVASAAGGGEPLLSAPIERGDYSSLQRGAKLYVNYCSGCHSAVYMRYGRVAEDLGIPEDLLRTRLMYNEAGLADGMISAMRQEDATEWFYQAAPPDLSLSAKLRGVDWLYSYLHAFYRDDTRPSGWNNRVFPNVAMPHVLADLQGEIALSKISKNEDGEGGNNGDSGKGNSEVILREGRLSAQEYDVLVTDLVNFMDYMAEPSRADRYRAGYVIISILLLLLISTFFLYREYWRDIH